MTIRSNVHGSDRKVTFGVPFDGNGVTVRGDDGGSTVFVIDVSPEGFAREINEAGIPGLTVTYEKPAPPLPTDPGWYAARDDIDSGGNYGVILLDAGSWQNIDTAQHWHEHLGGLVRLIPESEADL